MRLIQTADLAVFTYTDTYAFVIGLNICIAAFYIYMCLVLSWGLTMDSLSSVLPAEYIGLMMKCDKYGLSKFYFTWGVRGHLWGGNNGLYVHVCCYTSLCNGSRGG